VKREAWGLTRDERRDRDLHKPHAPQHLAWWTFSETRITASGFRRLMRFAPLRQRLFRTKRRARGCGINPAGLAIHLGRGVLKTDCGREGGFLRCGLPEWAAIGVLISL
jgi:hypothetical protein